MDVAATDDAAPSRLDPSSVLLFQHDYDIETQYFPGFVRCSFPVDTFPDIQAVYDRIAHPHDDDPVQFQSFMILKYTMLVEQPVRPSPKSIVKLFRPHWLVYVRDMTVPTPPQSPGEFDLPVKFRYSIRSFEQNGHKQHFKKKLSNKKTARRLLIHSNTQQAGGSDNPIVLDD